MMMYNNTPNSSIEPLGVYLHIPFCRSKCPYCDFCSFPRPDEGIMSAYVTRLIESIVDWGEKCRGRTVDTVYFGGGTPTLLHPMDAKRLISAVFEHFSVEKDAEVTLECNPATLTSEALSAWVSGGINRVSMGAQSAHEAELKALGRLHTWEDVCYTVEMVRLAGVNNVNLDFMMGIPHQTPESLIETLKKAIELSPDHLSAYCLMLEEGTPFARRGAEKLGLPEEDRVADFYESASAYVRSKGYEHYEISNFARDGKRSRHNLHTWQGREYVGLGVAAHGYVDGVRYGNSRDLAAFLEGKDITESRIPVTTADAAEEAVMLGLRLSDGIHLRELAQMYPLRLSKNFYKLCRNFVDGGWMTFENEKIALTEKGFLVSNQVIASLLETLEWIEN